MLDSNSLAYGLEHEGEAARAAVADYAREFERPSDSGPAQQASAQAALTRLAGSIDESRSLYNRLLGRAYRPRLERPRSPDPKAEQDRFTLATKLLDYLDKTDLENCEAQEAELRDAAYAALIAVARDRVALGRPDPLIKRDATGLGGLAARARDMKCGSNGECVLLARLELLRSEAFEEGADRHVAAAKAHALTVIRRAAAEGPSLSAAEAWMVLAELDPVAGEKGGAELNPGHVGNAYATVERLGLAGIRQGNFRHRLLPIYQAAADAAYARTAGESEASRAQALLEVGEAARRAQIEYVLADACEPVKVPLAPEHLRAGETIVYPMIGRLRTYLLVGTNKGPDAAGWAFRDESPEGGPAAVGDAADRLVASLQRVSEENVRFQRAPTFADQEIDRIEWAEKEAQKLDLLLLAPIRGLLPKEEVSADKPAPVLIFFPDPLLRNVPWALLHRKTEDPKRSYLVKFAALAVGTALAYVRPSEQPDHRGRLVAGALRGDRAGLENFVLDLPYVVPKLRGVDLLTQGIDRQGVATNRPFTGTALLDRMRSGGVSVLLIATHAQFSGGESSIAVEPTPPYDKGELPLTAIENSLRAGRRRASLLDLLILVSCEGATGDAGELGLAGAALRGGAAGTIGSVIRVNSFAAPIYFAAEGRDSFLKAYYADHSPAQSLRKAQLDAMNEMPIEPGMEVEANWGSFILIGNWR